MGDVIQTRTGRSGKPWWILKKRKKNDTLKKKKRKGKVEGKDAQSSLTDQVTSGKDDTHVEKKTEGEAQVASGKETNKYVSKQARKRKQKRQEKLNQKLETKDKLRSDKQLKKRKRQFKKKKRKEEETVGKNTETNSKETSTIEEEGNEEDETPDQKRQKDVEKVERSNKRKGTPLNGKTEKKAIKDVDGGKVSVDMSGDRSADSETTPEIDSNWRNLMKSINYQPPEKKKKLAKAKDDKPEIWFDDVDPELMDEEDRQGLSDDLNKVDPLHHGKGNPNLNNGSESAGLTKYVGLDCEMVGIGPNGKESMLARVSIVNQHGLCIYDKFVAPQEEVTNFRSEVTGITSKDLQNADNFTMVQEEVSSILKGRILVGHALHNDLKVLFLTHPKSMIRDTSTYKKFKELSKGKKPKLKKLSEMVLKVRIQEGAHNSVQDAQAAMKLFMLHRINWEKELAKQGWRKLKIKTNQEAEVLISAPSSLPNTEI